MRPPDGAETDHIQTSFPVYAVHLRAIPIEPVSLFLCLGL